MKGVAAVFLLALACLAGAPALAQDEEATAEGQRTVYEGFTLEQIQNLMQTLGLQAETVQDQAGPYLRSAAQGQGFFVTPYECNTAVPAVCQSVQLVSGVFTPTQPVTAEKINEWNRKYSWARGILDQSGQPYLRNDFSTTGGVTEEWFTTTLRIWTDQLGKFYSYVSPTAQ
jgi:hypothetical protein